MPQEYKHFAELLLITAATLGAILFLTKEKPILLQNTPTRRVFYSFHYDQDVWRTAQVRNIGMVEGNRPATDNTWEQIKRAGATAIQQWIDQELEHRSCTVVLGPVDKP